MAITRKLWFRIERFKFGNLLKSRFLSNEKIYLFIPHEKPSAGEIAVPKYVWGAGDRIFILFVFIWCNLLAVRIQEQIKL